MNTLQLHWINISWYHSIPLHILCGNLPILWWTEIVQYVVASLLSNTTYKRMVVQDPKKFAFMYLHISHLHLYHAWVCFFKSIYIVFFLLACESANLVYLNVTITSLSWLYLVTIILNHYLPVFPSKFAIESLPLCSRLSFGSID